MLTLGVHVDDGPMGGGPDWVLEEEISKILEKYSGKRIPRMPGANGTKTLDVLGVFSNVECEEFAREVQDNLSTLFSHTQECMTETTSIILENGREAQRASQKENSHISNLLAQVRFDQVSKENFQKKADAARKSS